LPLLKLHYTTLYSTLFFSTLLFSPLLFSSHQNIENELSGILEVLLLHNTAFALLPSETSTTSSDDNDNDVTRYERNRMELQSLIDEDLARRVGLENHKKSCKLQLQELKSMLKEISKKEQKENECENEKEKKRVMGSAGPRSVSVQCTGSAVISVFADILLHVRNNLTETSGPLEEDQRALFSAVKSDYRKVHSGTLGCRLLV
jgi:hypothetical protein